MHHALEIQEILASIFRCFDGCGVDLLSLARTCRTFKEPALDALWSMLRDLTPVVRCLPEACQQLSWYKYSFHRPPTQMEWDILRRYTCRIRSIQNLGSYHEPDAKSLHILSNPPTAEPLFPNLRSLHYPFDLAPLLQSLPLPSLLSVTFILRSMMPLDKLGLNDFLQAFPKLCPNVKLLHFDLLENAITSYRKAISDCICGWRSLKVVLSPTVPLDTAAIAYLSRMDGLVRLHFALDTSLSFDSPLVFSNLYDLSLRSKSCSSISQFLSHAQLPDTTGLTAIIPQTISQPELSSLFANIQISGAGSTIIVSQERDPWNRDAHCLELLGLEDLRPCMGFSNLGRIRIDISWNVGLTDTDLLTLALAWPRLQELSINCTWGWNTACGITPNGLLRILQACPLLRYVALRLAVDTRGDVAFTSSPEIFGPTLPRSLILDVLDSIIDEDLVPCVAAFFACVASLPDFRMYVHKCVSVEGWAGWAAYERRWKEVYARAQDMIRQRRPTTE